MEVRVLCFQLTEDRCFSKRSSKPMAFANFSVLWGFLDFLTILQLFDNFLTNLPTVPLLPPSTSSYLTITLAVLVDELLMHLSGVLRWIFIIMTTIITAITTNLDSALLGSCCRLNTPWSLQHQGKWCSYPAKLLDEPLITVGWTLEGQHNMSGHDVP